MSNQEWSDANDGEEKKAGRMNWSEKEDLKLVSAWFSKREFKKGENF
jgi:hypothetical protein